MIVVQISLTLLVFVVFAWIGWSIAGYYASDAPEQDKEPEPEPTQSEQLKPTQRVMKNKPQRVRLKPEVIQTLELSKPCSCQPSQVTVTNQHPFITIQAHNMGMSEEHLIMFLGQLLHATTNRLKGGNLKEFHAACRKAVDQL